MRFALIIITLGLSVWLQGNHGTACAQIISGESVSAELIAKNSSLQPGEDIWVGVRLSMAPGWHVNWLNPGDAGLPPTIEWVLPEGFIAGPIAWPYPKRHDIPGLTIFGYDEEVLLLTRITAPKSLEPGTTVTLKASVSWLACREGCVPGDTVVKLDLPVLPDSPRVSTTTSGVFQKAMTALPVKSNGWRLGAVSNEHEIKITAEPISPIAADDPGEVYFYPADQGIIDNTASQEWIRSGERFTLTVLRASMGQAVPPRLKGVLVSSKGWDSDEHKALELDTPVARKAE